MKVIACLGNPGSEYSTTRHNVGWWMAERLMKSWGFKRFHRERGAALSAGSLGDCEVRIIEPLTYMNRSGAALAPLRRMNSFDIARDLLVVVDDVALEPGRARFRAAGSAGGHNGLKSVESSLGTQAYARLRIGVGARPSGMDLADWVLSSPSAEDRKVIQSLLPQLVDCVELWATQGIETAMNHCNT